MAELTPDADHGQELKWQRYDPTLGIITQGTERMKARADAEADDYGQAAREITPQDINQSLVRTHTAPTSALEAVAIVTTGLTDVDFPPVLESITSVYEENTGIGDATEDGEGGSAGENASLSLALKGTAQSSAALMPDLQITITDTWGKDLPVKKVKCFLPYPVEMADITAKLAAILGAPVAEPLVFRPVAHTLTLRGQKVSIQASANVQQHVSLGTTTTYTKSVGRGESKDVGSTVTTIRLPPTIHGTITIGDTNRTTDITATASATITSGVNWPALTQSETAEGQVTASISPTSLDATPPTQAIPTSGLRIVKLNDGDTQYGYAMIYAEVLDFSIFA